jgi:hypothetical protein
MMCNYMVCGSIRYPRFSLVLTTRLFQGNERWVEAMETKFSEKFRKTKSVPWTPMRSDLVSGEIRTAGNVTFLNIHEAG